MVPGANARGSTILVATTQPHAVDDFVFVPDLFRKRKQEACPGLGSLRPCQPAGKAYIPGKSQGRCEIQIRVGQRPAFFIARFSFGAWE